MFDFFRKKDPDRELKLVYDELDGLKKAVESLRASIKTLEREQDDLHARYRRIRATQAGDKSAENRGNGHDLVGSEGTTLPQQGLDLRTQEGKALARRALRERGLMK